MDSGSGSDDDITATHPTARHLRAADEPAAASPEALDHAASFPSGAHQSYDVVPYGPDIDDEQAFRLLGNLEGKRVLELGCGAGHASIAMAKQGAKVITVDPSAARLDQVRAACEREEVRVELHQADLAELAFIRGDTIDLVLSVFALSNVADPDRVFRQAHRVLRQECHLVFSVSHPVYAMVGGADLRVTRTYWDRSSRPWATGEASGAEYPRTVSDIFTGLSRANFRVDTMLEPEPAADAIRSAFWTQAMAWVPATLVIRARKEGI
jgi:SAM-dependent methyltransferase